MPEHDLIFAREALVSWVMEVGHQRANVAGRKLGTARVSSAIYRSFMCFIQQESESTAQRGAEPKTAPMRPTAHI